MNIDLALEKIYSLKQFHVKLGLDNITNLLDYLGNPQCELKTIHVAGSNGKGSTCSFLSSILQEHGYSVGLYTSPHFVRFNERIKVNEKEIDDYNIINFLEKHKDYIDEHKPTFFEITTALAFEYFKDLNVDYAIIETGLGGRLDATNVLKPLASVITSISLEHSHILGDSLEKIAFEKGGIIKNNTPVFCGLLPDSAKNTIEEIAKKKNCAQYNLKEYITLDENDCMLKIEDSIYEIKDIGLKGKHQLLNAGLAVLVIKTIINNIREDKFNIGLKNVVMNSGIQGRYERIGQFKNVIFDAAHNLEGVEIFCAEFKKEISLYKSRTLIFGAMRDKEIGKMLNLLKNYFDNIFVTSTNYERAAKSSEIKKIADKLNIKVEEIIEPWHQVNKFCDSNKQNCLVVLGSIYLLGEIKKYLKNDN